MKKFKKWGDFFFITHGTTLIISFYLLLLSRNDTPRSMPSGVLVVSNINRYFFAFFTGANSTMN